MVEKKNRLDLEIAILGGGFSSIYCGKALRKTLARDSSAKIGLICDENYMVFQPMLPEVASASLSPRHVTNPIRLLCKGLNIYKGEVESIDPEKKELTIRPGPFSPEVVIGFQHLVLGLGAKVDLSRVPGMPEHAYLMQNVGDAMKLRAAVLARFEEANLVRDPVRRGRLLTFVVVGGGYSGVETAGQILDLFNSINKYYKNVSEKDFSVELIHSREYLLQSLNEKLGRYAERKLSERGLKIRLNTRVSALTANQVILSDGSAIETNTCVSTVGNSPHPLVTKLIEDIGADSERGRIKTKPTLQVEGCDWLWAAGDCAAVPFEGKEGEFCPPNAQFAMRQGSLLGKNLNAFIRNEDLKPFKFKGLGELAAIGHMTAVAEVMGLRFSGFIAWWMWRTIYLSKLPGIDRKLRVMIDWTLDVFFPRDINLLSPRYTTAIKESHLQSGDVLFNPGEPAFSFYIVKRGSIDILDKDQQLIKTVGAGEFFGERALLDDKKWRFQAKATEETTLVGLGGDEFKALLQNSTSMRELFEKSAQQYQSASEIDAMQKTLPEVTLRSNAEDLMTSEIIQLELSQSVIDTLEILKEHRHTFYPVFDNEEGITVGALERETFYDYIQQKGLSSEHRISDVRLTKLPAVRRTDSISDCLQVMTRSGQNKLMVTTEENKLEGILTMRDIVNGRGGIPASEVAS